MTIYKMRRGKSVSKDVILKAFTVKKGTWITDKYVNKEGGWEISTNNFHSGKYVYYFALSNQWAWTNNKEVETTSRMSPMSYVRNGNSKSWVWSKPGSGYKKFNISKFKHTVWKTDHAAQLMYNKKTIYYHIKHGKYSGWISHNALKFAPHKSIRVSPLSGIPAKNADGSNAFYMNTSSSYRAIQFNASPSTTWVAFPGSAPKQAFEKIDWYGNKVASKLITIIE